MFLIKYILFSLIFFNNNTYTIDKLYEGKIFYNLVIYENELYVSSNSGIYKIDSSNNNSLLIFNKDVIGPVKTDFTKDNDFKVKFQKIDGGFELGVNIQPKVLLNALTDYAFHNNRLFIIRRGKLVSLNKKSIIMKGIIRDFLL